jgi:hypothetical protein
MANIKVKALVNLKYGSTIAKIGNIFEVKEEDAKTLAKRKLVEELPQQTTTATAETPKQTTTTTEAPKQTTVKAKK